MCDVVGAWRRLSPELRAMLMGRAQVEGVDLERYVYNAPWILWPLVLRAFGPVYGRGVICLLAEEMGISMSTAMKILSSREAWEEYCGNGGDRDIEVGFGVL